MPSPPSPAASDDAAPGAPRTLVHPLWVLSIFSLIQFTLGLTTAAFCRLAFKPEAAMFAQRIVDFLLASTALLIPFDFVAVFVWLLAPYRRVRDGLSRGLAP